jgi:mono/diheme cytochrome c family protein
MLIRSLAIAGFAFIATVTIAARHDERAAAAPTASAPSHPGRLCGGEPCDAVARGLLAFLDRRPAGLGGNGRSCADCHMPTGSFQLSPADVEFRYRLLQLLRFFNPKADDPLFRPIDADDFQVNGDRASDFSNLRQNGLVRIVFPLPPNIRVIDPATNLPSADVSVDVWRSVPSVLNVALSGPGNSNPWPREPNAFGGYQLDARVSTLQEQALGAFVNHAQVEGVPAQRTLDDLSSFERALFTRPQVQDLADAMRTGSPVLPDPDPPLNVLEQQGKTVFQRACAQCHGGHDQTTAQPPVPHFQDIRTQCPRPVDTANPARFVFPACPDRLARNARTYQITLNATTSMRRTSSDPGRALLTGFVGGPAPTDDWNKLDVPQLRGISRTAPYFHNNSASTLEDVVDHYMAFFTQLRVLTAPGAPPPPPTTTDGVHFDRAPLPEERQALLAYLRKL